MRLRLKSVSLALTQFSLGIATLLLSLSPSLLPTAHFQLPASAQTIQDRKAQADRLLQQGNQQFDAAQFREALQSYEAALSIFQEIGAQSGAVNVLNKIGLIYSDYSLKQYQKAIDFYQQALNLARGINDLVKQAEILSNLGEAYGNLEQPSKAIEFNQQALSLAREIGDRTKEVNTLFNLGVNYSSLGQSAKALEFYQQAVSLARAIKYLNGQVFALNNIARVYLRLEQYPKVIEVYRQSLAIIAKDNTHVTWFWAKRDLGIAYCSMNQIPLSIEVYQQALFFNSKVNDLNQQVTAITDLGSTCLSLGRYSRSIYFSQQALSLYQKLANPAGQAYALHNIGSGYSGLSQYPKSIEFYQQALKIQQELNNPTNTTRVLLSLGGVYLSLGQVSKALEYLQQAIVPVSDRSSQLTQQLEPLLKTNEGRQRVFTEDRSVLLEWDEAKSLQANVLNGLGYVYLYLGQYSQSIESYQQALAIFPDPILNDDRPERARSFLGLGITYEKLGQSSQALESHQQALKIFQNLGNQYGRIGQGQVLANLGNVYASQGKYSQAQELYQQALRLTREIGDRRAEGIVLSQIGSAYLKTGNAAAAEKFLFDAIAIWDTLRPGLIDQNKVSLFDTQVNTYSFLQQALIVQEKTERALEVAERGRARALIELLASRLTDGSLPITKPTSAQIKQIAQTQVATMVQYSIVSDEDLYIWVIQPNGKIHFHKSDLTQLKTPLSQRVVDSRTAIGARSRDNADVVVEVNEAAKQQRREQQTRNLRQLHQLLIEPIAQFLPQEPDQQVIFIPQGSLFLVPFPALLDANGKALIEQHTILTAPSIQVLDLARQKVVSRQPSIIMEQQHPALVVGNPTMPKVTTKLGETPVQLSTLPGAEREAIAIAQILNTKALIGTQAKKADVVQRMKNASVIHLATHGLLDSFKGDVPGAIALAPSGNNEVNDGLLTAGEIFNMKLNADLVVLSACDTGRGDLTGDGVIGLSRTLFIAGVPSVIVSLWKVPDKPTAFLMTEFYRNWQERNLNKAQALRQAMLTTKGKYPQPLDWAAFTLIGEAK